MPFHHTLDTDVNAIAVLTLALADKSVNILTSEVIEELTQTLKRLHAMKEVKALMIRSAKPNQFIAGASIDEIASITDPREAETKSKIGQELMSSIETLPYPSIAVIDGPCLGGGLELALACTYRVAAEGSHVRLSLPEVRLGIIPGFGGTQRLPRIVGLIPAIELIVGSKTLNSRRALRIGLVDDIAASQILEDVARRLVLRHPRLRRPTRTPMWQNILERIPPVRTLILNKARQKTLEQTKGFYPAPLAAIDVLSKTLRNKKVDGYEIEARTVGELVTSHVSKSLIRLFQATEEIRHEPREQTPLPIHKVGLLGAGVMGGGIAQLIGAKGRLVRLRDISIEALGKGMQTVHELNTKELKRKKITAREAKSRWAMISPTTDLTGFTRTDLVIEAVVEKLEIKKRVLSEISEKVRIDTILASNTSALSITEIASDVLNPERVVGIHFFNPVHKMPLVEIVQGRQTSPKTISTATAFALSIGKTPIVVQDRPGFLVNRVLGIYLAEVLRAAEDRVPVMEIENAMKTFGMPMGPFELMDEIGLDIAEEVGIYLSHSFDHFPKPTDLLTRLRKLGRLGKKNGAGFYLHSKSKKDIDSKTLMNLGLVAKKPADAMGATAYNALTDRFVLAMVNEAARCLEEKVVASARDVDIGMVLGTGFAPFRGGLLAYANYRSLADVELCLTELAKQFGEHYRPVGMIRMLAEKGGAF